MLCAGCHLNKEAQNLSGAPMLDAPEFGDIYAPNITQDRQYGIGEWKDSEIVYLLRTGIKRDGQYAPPYMVKLPHMADEDINAIVSFLRSDDPMVAADRRPDRPTDPSFLTKFLCRVVMKPFPYPTEKIAMPDTTDLVAHGKYLAHNLDCFPCHSANFQTVDFLDPEKSEGYFGGGNELIDEKGQKVYSANLTPDSATGIGSWSEEQFIRALKFGVVEDGPPLQMPMKPYVQLTDNEARAVYHFLRTLPPIENEVVRLTYE